MTHPLRRSSVGDVSYMGWGSGGGADVLSVGGSGVNLYWSLG